MLFYIAQLAGILSCAAAALSVQARKPGAILLGQFLSNVLCALCYGLLGSLSAAVVCLLASVHSVLIYIANKRDDTQRKRAVTAISILFSVAYVVATALTYTRWPDAISGLCALLYTLSVAQKEASKMRVVILANLALWLVIDVAVGAYASILTHGLTILSTILAMLRLDKKPTKPS